METEVQWERGVEGVCHPALPCPHQQLGRRSLRQASHRPPARPLAQLRQVCRQLQGEGGALIIYKR